ncbi:SLC13 family permease [Paraburkholderia sp.]|uniref:SLC13 family permease n=1 Tax=Paraburkholderia sp. TaxID=1926495 RepID=UPI002D5CB249|nr:SLC13 family permease [Paraburkholderia sp.]HZZ02685.1 SLC13 family permease [Paraburkholderia sp.]
MTTIHIVALVLLVVIFVVSLWRGINLGLVAIPATFLLVEIAGVPQKRVFAAFPTDLVLLILGVMYLWNLVRDSGLAELIVHRAVALARGRPWLLPWTTCTLTALICALGALPIAALVITLPVALEIARRENIRPALMGIVTIQGGCIGGLSPFNPWAKVVIAQAAKGGVTLLPTEFFFCQFAINLAFALLAFFAFGGSELIARPKPRDAAAQTVLAAPSSRSMLTWQQWTALAALLGFIALVLTRHDVGLSAFSMGILLNIAVRADTRKVVADLPWSMVIMISGILIYIGMLETVGVLQATGELLQSMEQQSLVRVGMTYLGTLMANFEASSVVVLGLVIPVVTRSLAHEPSALLASIQLALSASSIVVITASPFHLGGGLVLAELHGDDKTFKDLLKWTVALTLFLPLGALLIR